MAQSQPSHTRAADPAILFVPGLGGSSPSHWQSIWASQIADSFKVDLGSWDEPHRNTWINRLNLAIHRTGRPVILVAHSLGCHAVAWWAKFEQPEWANPVVGAMLVAPPEVDFFPLDERLSRFAPVPSGELPFPSILVASRNDPWVGFETATVLAKSWGSHLWDAGLAGHLNSESGHGEWTEGREILARLIGRAGKSKYRAVIGLTQGEWAEGLEYRA